MQQDKQAIAGLEAKLKATNGVLLDVMEEYVALKVLVDLRGI